MFNKFNRINEKRFRIKRISRFREYANTLPVSPELLYCSKRGFTLAETLITLTALGIIAAIGIISQAGPYARDRVAGYAFAIAAICTLYGLFMFGMLYGIGLIVDNTNATNQRLDQMNYK